MKTVENGRVVSGELVASTEKHDGYNGAMAKVDIYFAAGEILVEHSSGVFRDGYEVDAPSVSWRLENDPAYRTYRCNKFFRPYAA